MMASNGSRPEFYGHVTGHLFPGCAILLIGLWWLYNVVTSIASSRPTTEIHLRDKQSSISTVYESRTWYPIARKKLPIEPCIRGIIALSGAIIELMSCKFKLFNDIEDPSDEAVFQMSSVSNMAHISMYLLFLGNSLVEVLTYYRLLPSFKYASHFTMSLALFGVGFLFYFHLDDHRSPIDVKAHQILYSICFGASFTVLMEARSPHVRELSLLRCYLGLLLGSWFFQVVFTLYTPHHWSLTARSDSMFLPIVFIWHCIGWLAVIVTVVLSREVIVQRRRSKGQMLSHGGHEHVVLINKSNDEDVDTE